MKYLLLLTLVASTFGQERCTSPKVQEGICLLVNDCPILKDLAEFLPINKFIELYGGCGKDQNEDLRLCCPVPPGFASTSSTIGPRQPVPGIPPLLFTTGSPSPTPTPLPDTTPSRRPITTSQRPITTSRRPITTSQRPITTSRRPITTSQRPITTVSSSRGSCPTPYSPIAGQCLYVSTIGSKHLSWTKAMSKCVEMDGTLAVLENEEETAMYLKDNNLGGPSAWYWIGANDNSSPDTYRWTNGHLVEGPWRDAKPWAVRAGQMCVYFTDGGFGRTPCSDQTWYICQHDATGLAVFSRVGI